MTAAVVTHHPVGVGIGVAHPYVTGNVTEGVDIGLIVQTPTTRLVPPVDTVHTDVEGMSEGELGLSTAGEITVGHMSVTRREILAYGIEYRVFMLMYQGYVNWYYYVI